MASFLGWIWMIFMRGLLTLTFVYPIVILDLPLWADLTICFVASVLPQFYSVIWIPLWIWGLVSAIQGPQDIFAIIYYVLFVVFALPTLVKTIIRLSGGR